jgi:hypothetical protein
MGVILNRHPIENPQRLAEAARQPWPPHALGRLLGLGLLCCGLGQALATEQLEPAKPADQHSALAPTALEPTDTLEPAAASPSKLPSTDRAPASRLIAEDQVLQLDLSKLDANGLQGPASGKRSLSYEFCIPKDAHSASEVQRLDPSAQQYTNSRGRIGCMADQILVIGHTHQPNFADILHQLAELPYVERIIESHFE